MTRLERLGEVLVIIGVHGICAEVVLLALMNGVGQ